MTRSPTWKAVTPAPTAATVPAASLPGMNGGSGRTWYLPASISTSTYDTPRAPMRTWISPAPGAGGSGTSRNASTSGPPNASQTIAFIDTPSLVYARVADDLAPLSHVGLEYRPERFGRAADRFDAGREQPLRDVPPVERFQDLAVQPRDDRLRRLRRSEHARH